MTATVIFLKICAIMKNLHLHWIHSVPWEDEPDSKRLIKLGGALRGVGLREGALWPVSVHLLEEKVARRSLRWKQEVGDTRELKNRATEEISEQKDPT